MNIIIGADIVPTISNQDMFEKGLVEDLLGTDLLRIMENADFRVFNLEVPLTDVLQPIIKNGPNLASMPKGAVGLKAMNIDLLSLANNHIMDQNTQGLHSTIQTLEDLGIAYVGAGDNLSSAEKPYIFSIDGKTIGIYACAEHEFTIADKDTPGANPFNPLESLDHIAELKGKSDYVIVLYHGGKEFYRYPSPMLQASCRKMVDKGADLVICQHSHCIGSAEDWHGSKIIYGQGNFLFDHDESEYWQTGLLLQILEGFQIVFHPLVKKKNRVRLAEGIEREQILREFNARSEEIKDPRFVAEKYKEYSLEYLPNYIINIRNMKRPFVYKVINKLLRGTLDRVREDKYLKDTQIRLLNYIECEAHRELLISGLKNKQREEKVRGL